MGDSYIIKKLLYTSLLPFAMLVFVLFILCACQTTPSTKKSPLVLKPLVLLTEFHIKQGTHVDGPRCPMYPSCASYAKRAISEHGLIGLYMFIDRIIYRESGLLYLKYFPAPQKLSKALRYYDPVNDSLPIFQNNRPSFLREDFRTNRTLSPETGSKR